MTATIEFHNPLAPVSGGKRRLTASATSSRSYERWRLRQIQVATNSERNPRGHPSHQPDSHNVKIAIYCCSISPPKGTVRKPKGGI